MKFKPNSYIAIPMKVQLTIQKDLATKKSLELSEGKTLTYLTKDNIRYLITGIEPLDTPWVISLQNEVLVELTLEPQTGIRQLSAV